MNKSVFLVVTFLVLSILISGCEPKENITSPERVDSVPDIAEANEITLPQSGAETAVLPAEDANDVFSAATEPNTSELTAPAETEPNVPVVQTSESKPAEEVNVEPNIVEVNDVKLPVDVSFYDKYAQVLAKYVDEKGIVSYRDLRYKKPMVKQLLNEFDDLDPREYKRWTKDKQIAFWINVYNIQMFNIILANYPIESSRMQRIFWPPTSIRHIPPSGTIGAQKWNGYKLIVMDEEFTLMEIQRRFFLSGFKDPRVLLAVTQASLSSPPLRNMPYSADKLDEQLDGQVAKFLSSPRAFKIDRANKVVYLSAIFQASWHGGKFIDRYGTDRKFKDHRPAVRAVLNFITNYIDEKDIAFLEVENYTVKFIGYDWRLNE